MRRLLKFVCVAVLGGALGAGLGPSPALAAIMEIEITYYSEAAHSMVVGEYYRGCDGKVRMVGTYSDFYDYVGSTCRDRPGPID